MFKVKLFGLSSKYFLFVFLTSVSFYAPTVANATAAWQRRVSLTAT